MSSILKNILLFTLTAGQSSAQPHLLNNNDVAKVPRNLYLDGAGFIVSADATNVSVTRGANAASTVKVECEGWHSYEDAEPLPNGIAASLFPMVIQGAGSGGGGGITAVSGGTSTGTGPTIVFSNGGGISFGMSGNTMTASVQTAGGTATGVGIIAGTQTADTGAVLFQSGNGVTFGMSNSSVVTASVAAGATATGNFGALAAGTQTATSGTVALVNSNGMTFGMNGSTAITGSFSREAVIAVNGAGSITAGTAVLSDSNNVSFGLNGSTITASASFAAETPFGLSAGSQSVSTGTVAFANGGGVSFGMSGSNQITASIAAGATATGNFGAFAAGTQTATSGTVALVNSNGLTFGMNGSTGVTASVSREPSISVDGAGVISAGTVVFSNGGNVTFGLAGSTITANGPAAGTGGGIALAAGGQTATSGTVVLSASSGVFPAMSGSTHVTFRVASVIGTGGELADVIGAGARIYASNAGSTLNLLGAGGVLGSAGQANFELRATSDVVFSAHRSLSATIVSDIRASVGRSMILNAGSAIGMTGGAGSVGIYAAGTGGLINLLADSAMTVKAPNMTLGADTQVQLKGGGTAFTGTAAAVLISADSGGIGLFASHSTRGNIALVAGRQVNIGAGGTNGSNAVIYVDATNGVMIQGVSTGTLAFFGEPGATRPQVSTSTDLTVWLSRLNDALVNLGLISTL